MAVIATEGAWQRERLKNYFQDRLGETLTYDELVEACPTTRKGLTYHITRIRQDLAGQFAVWNIYGKGYKMVRSGTCPYCGK